MELQTEQWNLYTYRQFTDELKGLSEKKYREFCIKIVHAKTPILGVRQPTMRKLASEILKGNALSFLEVPKGDALEEQMMHGYVLAKIKLPYEQKLTFLFPFLERMDNWSVCDNFVTALKPFIRENCARFLADIRHLAMNENPWKVRFLLVVLLECYLEPDTLADALSLCKQIKREEYYVKMAQAWLLSMAYVQNPCAAMEALQSFEQDRFITLKTISKIIDSYQVTEDQKDLCRNYRDNYKKRHGNQKK